MKIGAMKIGEAAATADVNEREMVRVRNLRNERMARYLDWQKQAETLEMRLVLSTVSAVEMTSLILLSDKVRKAIDKSRSTWNDKDEEMCLASGAYFVAGWSKASTGTPDDDLGNLLHLISYSEPVRTIIGRGVKALLLQPTDAELTEFDLSLILGPADIDKLNVFSVKVPVVVTMIVGMTHYYRSIDLTDWPAIVPKAAPVPVVPADAAAVPEPAKAKPEPIANVL